MKYNSTLIDNVSAEQIESLFKDIQKQLDDIKKNFQPKTPDEYLTRNEVAAMLKVNLSTIHIWCKNGKLIPLGIGSRVYFRRSDIEAAMVPIGINRGDQHRRL
jgi:excisionase family DNA binding protein